MNFLITVSSAREIEGHWRRLAWERILSTIGAAVLSSLLSASSYLKSRRDEPPVVFEKVLLVYRCLTLNALHGLLFQTSLVVVSPTQRYPSSSQKCFRSIFGMKCWPLGLLVFISHTVLGLWRHHREFCLVLLPSSIICLAPEMKPSFIMTSWIPIQSAVDQYEGCGTL